MKRAKDWINTLRFDFLAEEGFEVAGRQPRAVRSTTVASSRKAATKSSVSVEHKRSSVAHHNGPTPSPAHHSQPKSSKKPKVNRPTKPGKKDTRRHHQQKKHKKSTETKAKQSDKHIVKPR